MVLNSPTWLPGRPEAQRTSGAKNAIVVAPVVGEAAVGERALGDGVVHRHQLDRGDAERDEVLEDRVHAEPEIASAQRLRNVGVQPGHALDVTLVDHRPAPRRARRAVVSPAERGLGHDALRHGARAVRPARHEVTVRVAGVVAEEHIAPADGAAERAGVRVDEQLRRVEAVAVLGVPGTVDAVAVELAGAEVGKIRMPDEAVALAQRDAVGLARIAGGGEQTEIDGGRVLREESEVDPLAIPRGAERIRHAGPDPHGARF